MVRVRVNHYKLLVIVRVFYSVKSKQAQVWSFIETF